MSREMRHSGIEWIGEIPKEWKVARIKTIFKERTELSETGTEKLLSVSEYYGVDSRASRIDEGEYLSRSESLVGYKKCYERDFVSNIMLAWKGSFGVTKIDGIVSPAYCVYQPFDSIYSFYYHYLFRTSLYTTRFKLFSRGIIDSRLRLYSPYFYDIEAIIPPLSEQQKIADYLDKVCGEVDEMIALQEQMIEELKAYKQSVITEAVTKGLNPDVPMKDSGIDWIGEVPEHWDICRLKFLCKYIKDGTHFSPTTVSEGYPYITATDVRGVGIDYKSAKKITHETFLDLQKAGCQPHKGDVLLVKDGATTGRVGMMIDNEECVLLSSVAMLSPNNNISSSFLMYFIMSDFMQFQIQLAMAGTALPRITLSKLVNFLGVLCPLSEQQTIASYLDTKCAEIDALIAIKQAKIEELKDYKKSVIYEYVTGKKEVV